MENTESNKENLTVIDKDAQIHVVVNSSDEDGVVIDLRRVLHNMAKKARVYIWVLLLCLAAGVSLALVLYQVTKPYLTVSSVVTLNYDVVKTTPEGQEMDPEPVSDLTAPDGEDLDLSQITSSYVLQKALDGLNLSAPVTLPNLRNNIRIERILTEDSRRQQEVAWNMIEDKNSGAYSQVQEIELTYVNRFVVSLTNGFGDEDSRTKQELTSSELRLVLDRILDAYNDYLITTYADVHLPDDEISVIDVENLDILESLDLLREAINHLTEFCEEKSDTVRQYRSWRTGLSLDNLLTKLQMISTNNVEYLYSYAYTNSIVLDRNMMLTNYQYDLRNVQQQLDVVNENIRTNAEILASYVNDEIYVSMQESDTAKSTKTTTDYYNKLIVSQAENYAAAADLETTIADLQDKITVLTSNTETVDAEQAKAELDIAMEMMKEIYTEIRAQFQEIITTPTFTSYAQHSVAQGKLKNFLAASAKKMIIFGLLGVILACGLWLFSGLEPELMRTPGDKKADRKSKTGKMAEGKEAEQ